MKDRDHLLQKAITISGKSNRNTEEWRQYRAARNRVVWEINRSKREYYIKSIEDSKGKPDKMWKSINNILNGNKKSPPLRSIKVDEVEVEDPSAIAESFCNYFANITAKFNIKKPSTNTCFTKLKEFVKSKRDSN